ncbi:uncharacterized protein LOC106881884 [Octopus bimaculoides]|uniref:MADF domain-containing protein n=1 Tax=Octopus bimaculoides TaxID=37653 RepID=A0A0L8FQ69_OCTBM|nr:uncharacterized protein LOC106881884 [Octopus bimaculoides]|eukprot:XP_014787892.1 PREDICTED: uncharacterized protein LOC106881884 [Octopus bimaculoides]
MASMERVDLTMTSSQIEFLIELYRERELLWNPDHENYTYRPARAMALREIAEKMGVGWTEDLVKKKWNVLKSAYNRELKRLIELSKISSDVYAPQWWLFQNLDRFLRPHALSRKRAVESHSIEDGSPGPSFERIEDSYDGSMECGEAKERFMRTESARNSCMKSEDMQTICIEAEDSNTSSNKPNEPHNIYIEPEVIQNIYMEPENIQTLLTEPQELRNRSIKQESQTNGWRDYSLTRNDCLASGGERFSLSEEVSNSLENRMKKTAFNHCTLMVDQFRNRTDSRTVRLNERRDAEDLYCAMMATELKSISNEDLKDEAKFEMMRILKDFKKKDRQLKQNALPAPDHI